MTSACQSCPILSTCKRKLTHPKICIHRPAAFVRVVKPVERADDIRKYVREDAYLKMQQED